MLQLSERDMTLSLGIILIICVPFILVGGMARAPSGHVRRIALRVCVVLSAIAGVLCLFGLTTWPVIVLSYVPVYQIELCRYVMNQFARSYGREMQLIAFGIVADPDLRKDARYSTAYFAGALGVPMLFLAITLS